MDDLKNVGESSCNPGDGTDQRVQSLTFMMMMMMMMMMMIIKHFFLHIINFFFPEYKNSFKDLIFLFMVYSLLAFLVLCLHIPPLLSHQTLLYFSYLLLKSGAGNCKPLNYQIVKALNFMFSIPKC